jgi:hypothetical protein
MREKEKEKLNGVVAAWKWRYFSLFSLFLQLDTC